MGTDPVRRASRVRARRQRRIHAPDHDDDTGDDLDWVDDVYPAVHDDRDDDGEYDDR